MLVGTSKEFVFERITPIFGPGYKETFLTGASNLFAFSGIAYLYLIMPMLKNKSDFKKVSIISMGVSWIFLFLSIASLLLVLPFITYSEEVNSLYVITRLVKYGDFLQRTDALFIFLWILSTLSYLSIVSYFIIHITQKLTNVKHSKELIFSYAGIFLGLFLIPKDSADLKVLEDIIFKNLTLFLNFIFALGIMILAYIKKKRTD